MGVFASKDQDKRLPSSFDCEKMHGQDGSTKTYMRIFIIIDLWGSKWIDKAGCWEQLMSCRIEDTPIWANEFSIGEAATLMITRLSSRKVGKGISLSFKSSTVKDS